MNILLIVLTSSAVGVIVGGVIGLIGQSLERRARRDELLLAKSLEVAIHRTNMALTLARDTKVGVTLKDEVINAETYYRWLRTLLDTGKLPPEAHKVGPD